MKEIKAINNQDAILPTFILAIIVILFIIYFSKSATIGVLLYTTLGRTLLVLITIFVSSYNLMYGLLVVLVIIMLSLSLGTNHYYMEGFKQINIMEETKKKKDLTNDPNHNWFYSPSLKSLEGRDQIGMEDNIRGGKPSNSIPVLPHSMLDNENVLPNDPGSTAFESLKSVF